MMAQSLPKELIETKDIKLTYITASSDLSAAIDEKGKIYTWGKTKGMMALDQHGLAANLLSPTPLNFREAENELFTIVSCGRTHMAAVTADGKL